MNSQMTDFAFAGKCGRFGASGLTATSAAAVLRPCWSRRPARASRPKPLPTRRRNSRRVRWTGWGVAKSRGMVMITSRGWRRGHTGANPKPIRVAAVLHHAQQWQTDEPGKIGAARLGGGDHCITAVPDHLPVEADVGDDDTKPAPPHRTEIRVEAEAGDQVHHAQGWGADDDRTGVPGID